MSFNLEIRVFKGYGCWVFWKILKKINPQGFMSFYMDKAKRELLQKIYRGLRSEDDKIYPISPDIRVFWIV